uniref:Uncharacterized protein n=1 Tax=Lygus hesperus TaxID=30085 RepID=A0A146KZF5_LYGHE
MRAMSPYGELCSKLDCAEKSTTKLAAPSPVGASRSNSFPPPTSMAVSGTGVPVAPPMHDTPSYASKPYTGVPLTSVLTLLAPGNTLNSNPTSTGAMHPITNTFTCHPGTEAATTSTHGTLHTIPQQPSFDACTFTRQCSSNPDADGESFEKLCISSLGQQQQQ